MTRRQLLASGGVLLAVGALHPGIARGARGRGWVDPDLRGARRRLVTRLSYHWSRTNGVRLLLGNIAHNLDNLLRRFVLPLAIRSWSPTSLQQRVFKTGGRLCLPARGVCELTHEEHAPMWLEAGVYHIIRQRQYVPGMERRVVHN